MALVSDLPDAGVVTSFLAAALALAGSPGPNTLSLAAVAAAFGHGVAARYMFGLVLGMVVVMAVVGSGLQTLIFALPGAAPVVTAFAALYFLYLAYRIATAPALAAVSDPAGAPRWYEGTMLSLVNPKAYAAMAAMFSGFVLVAGSPLHDGLTKTALLVGVLFTVNVAWMTLGTALTRYLRDPRWSRVINVTFAILLILSVLAAMMI